jgi:hypothetical protein
VPRYRHIAWAYTCPYILTSRQKPFSRVLGKKPLGRVFHGKPLGFKKTT